MPEVAGFHTDFAPVVPESSPVRSTTRFQRHSARGSRSALARGFARSLQALLRERHVTVTEAAARMPAWELDAVRAYLSGTRLPSWDFVLTLIDATAASDHQQRNPIEQRLWNEWTAAASPPPRRTREREPLDRPQPRLTLRAAIATALGLAVAVAASFLAGAYLDDHRPVVRPSPPVAPSHSPPAPNQTSAAPLTLRAVLSPRAAGGITSVTWDPASTFIATSDKDKGTYVWDTTTDQQVTPELHGPGPAYDSAFNPSGTLLATGYSTGQTFVWDTRSWHLLARLTDPGSSAHKEVDSIAFSPDGTTMVTSDGNGQVNLWHVPGNGHASG